jgi:serine phosphatase RsbU (regulator of sigma subunit)/putative methionine-R-sulfoxide reductase with GAF domain
VFKLQLKGGTMKWEDILRNELSELYSEIDLSMLLQKIADKTKDYLNCEEASIFLYHSTKEELYFEIATGEKQDELKQMVLKKGEGIVGWIAENEKPLIINDCASDPRFTSKTDIKTNFKTNSILGVPVIRDNKLLGVLEAINKIKGEFDDRDRNILEYISQFVSIPLQNAMLFKKITQETRGKDRLLELGKIISCSSSLDEVLNKLKEIICDIITPLEINAIIQSKDKPHTYHLMDQRVSNKPVNITIEETNIGNTNAMIPLKSRDRMLGFLELKVKKNIPDEAVVLLKGLASFVAILIERLEMQSEMIEKEKIQKELQIARDIQQSFLLNKPIEIKGLDVAYINIPSSEVGGDYYDVVSLNESETIFTINDISGHGIPASLLMSIFRTNFCYRIKKDKDMVTTITHLNNLIAETTEANLYVTSFTGKIDISNKKITYINAGHNFPFIIRGQKLVKLDESSLAVGLFPDVSYQLEGISLKKDDILVLYTDGIVEAENKQGEQYSLERLIDFIKDNKKSTAEEIKEKFINELKDYTDQIAFVDDITFILVKIN